MATKNKQPSGKWQAMVRRMGRSARKSFIMRTDALKWARETEMQVERGLLTRNSHAASAKRTLGCTLAEYRDIVVTSHRSADREQRCIESMLKHHLQFTCLPWIP